MKKAALLIIDVQKGLDEPDMERNNPEAESNISLLLSEWRKCNLPVIHIRHCSTESDSPLRPELPGNEFKDEVMPLPGEQQFEKSTNSAFVGTGLEEYLREHDISELVVTGLTTDHCVSASTRSASDLGFSVTLISDATATFERTGHDGRHYTADEMHNINLASLNGEFCTVRLTKELLDVLNANKG